MTWCTVDPFPPSFHIQRLPYGTIPSSFFFLHFFCFPLLCLHILFLSCLLSFLVPSLTLNITSSSPYRTFPSNAPSLPRNFSLCPSLPYLCHSLSLPSIRVLLLEVARFLFCFLLKPTYIGEHSYLKLDASFMLCTVRINLMGI